MGWPGSGSSRNATSQPSAHMRQRRIGTAESSANSLMNHTVFCPKKLTTGGPNLCASLSSFAYIGFCLLTYSLPGIAATN